MEYLVMESKLSYAVVLDSQGRFLKVPNMGYEVGQTVIDVVIFDEPAVRSGNKRAWSRVLASAACACLMVLGGWQVWAQPTGVVRMQINPYVEMEVNRFDRVLSVEGLNADGVALVEGYDGYGYKIETVSDALADRAAEQGYLHPGGKITITVESDKTEWKSKTETRVAEELEIHFEHKIEIEVNTPTLSAGGQSVVIERDDGDSAYGLSDYGDEIDDGVTDYGKESDEHTSDYDAPENGDSPYKQNGDSEFEEKPEVSGESAYDDGEKGNSGYEKPDPASSYEEDDEGASGYQSSDYDED